MPTDELSERYLKKAIAEMNELGHEIAQAAGTDRAPVLGSGQPRGYYRKFGLSRIALRDLASEGQIPGVVKSSW